MSINRGMDSGEAWEQRKEREKSEIDSRTRCVRLEFSSGYGVE